MKKLVVRLEGAMQADVELLLQQSDAVAELLYPGEYRRPINAQSLANSDSHVLVARIAERAVGMCVVLARSDGAVELKRMIVNSDIRGSGIGRALLMAAEAQGKAIGANCMVLEVGVRNLAAQQLYQSTGFQLCDAFSPYKQTPISLFMFKLLEPLNSEEGSRDC